MDAKQQFAHLYYTGLPSQPLLIAKSASCPPLIEEGPPSTWMAHEPKSLYAIAPDHPLVNLWRHGLEHQVLDLVNELLPSATLLVPIGIGYTCQTARTVVWVGADRSTSEEAAQNLVDAVERVLLAHGLDVDVEVFSGHYTQAGPLYDPRRLPDIGETEAREHWRKLSTGLGAELCPDDESRQYAGSTGCWITVGPPEHREHILLTCHHVTHPKEDHVNIDFVPPGSQDHQRIILQNRSGNFDKFRKEMEMLLGEWTGGGEEIAEVEADARVKRYRAILAELDTRWRDPKDHAIGRVCVAPSVHSGFGANPPDGTQGRRWTRDVAGLRPFPEMFTGRPINQAPLDDSSLLAFTQKRYAVGWDDDKGNAGRLLDNPPVPPRCATVSLSGGIFDLKQSQRETRVLHKFGAASGFTSGVNNVIEARRRKFDSGPEWSSELVIVGFTEGKAGAFSAKGDSGGVVFDRKFNVYGIIHGGIKGYDDLHPSYNAPIRFDLTFATPISVIFQQLEENGVQNPAITAGQLYHG